MTEFIILLPTTHHDSICPFIAFALLFYLLVAFCLKAQTIYLYAIVVVSPGCQKEVTLGQAKTKMSGGL